MNDALKIAALEALGLEFRRVGRGQPVRRRGFGGRGLVAIAAALILAAGAAGAATQLIDTGDPIPAAPRGDFSAEQRPLTGSDHLSGVQTADPVGGPPWGLRLYRSETGDPCAVVGRLHGGQIGTLVGNEFRALPLSGPGDCVRFQGRRRPMSMTSKKYVGPGEAPRTVIYGVASGLVSRITFEVGGHSQTLVPDEDGAYLAVFEGYPRVTRIVYFVDGTRDVLVPPR